MITESNVLVINYPSGGFGNFLYHLLTAYADNTVKVGGHFFNFSATGNSHDNKRYTEPVKKLTDHYDIKFQDRNKLHLVTHDPGIDSNVANHYHEIRDFFPNAKIVHCYLTEQIRPVIYKTFMVKAYNKDPVSYHKTAVTQNWNSNEDYALRENFTKLYHNWSWTWTAMPDVVNFNLETFVQNPFGSFKNLVENTGGRLINKNKCRETLKQWYAANFKYFEIYWIWKDLNEKLDLKQSFNLESIKDIHDQGYLNYCIEKKYNIEIPVYDYKNWFQDTDQILKMIDHEKESFSNQ